VSKALLYALIAAAGNVLGALAVTRRAVRELRVIELLVAFGAGFMLSVAIVELLPAALTRSGGIAPVLVLVGYLAVHLTQHTVTPHFHFGEETHAVSAVAGTSGWWACCCIRFSTAWRSPARSRFGRRWASWCSSRSSCTSCPKA